MPSMPATSASRRPRVDSHAQRSLLPVGCFDHYDTLMLWGVCRETIGYARGRAIPVTSVMYRDMAEMCGLSTTALFHRAQRLESVGLIYTGPKGLGSRLREVDVKWPKVESD